MIIFAIPLRAKETTNDWNEITRLFNNTLQSIFNQKGSGNFKCIVACNDVPYLKEKYDERLEFIKMKLPIPYTWMEMAHDKFWKLTAISVRCREILENSSCPENGIYIMPVDADDLLSNRIALWCDEHPDANGFVSKEGYVWKRGERKLKIYPDMHEYCGSCNIIKMYREDLPDKMPYDDSLCHDTPTAKVLNRKYPIRFNHNEVVKKYSDIGKPFEILPFRSTIYVLGHGDNISSIYNSEYKANDNKRFHPVALVRSVLNIRNIRRLSKSICSEFSIDCNESM